MKKLPPDPKKQLPGSKFTEEDWEAFERDCGNLPQKRATQKNYQPHQRELPSYQQHQRRLPEPQRRLPEPQKKDEEPQKKESPLDELPQGEYLLTNYPGIHPLSQFYGRGIILHFYKPWGPEREERHPMSYPAMCSDTRLINIPDRNARLTEEEFEEYFGNIIRKARPKSELIGNHSITIFDRRLNNESYLETFVNGIKSNQAKLKSGDRVGIGTQYPPEIEFIYIKKD